LLITGEREREKKTSTRSASHSGFEGSCISNTNTTSWTVSLLQSLNPTKSSSNLSHNYSWPQFPPSLEQSGCLHWIPCTGNTEKLNLWQCKCI
jgi:hypothetical protein